MALREKESCRKDTVETDIFLALMYVNLIKGRKLNYILR